MTGQLQQAEQANSDLLAQIALHPSSPQRGPEEAAPANHMPSAPSAAGARICEKVPPQQGQLEGAPGNASSQWLCTDAAEDMASSSDDDETNQQSSSKQGAESSQHGSASQDGSSVAISAQQQQPSHAPDRQTSQSLESTSTPTRQSARQSDGSSAILHRRLQALAETLAMDVEKLKDIVESNSGCGPEGPPHSKVANWGFAKPEVGDSPGPSRPVTAAPCDNAQKPNRQWSAGSARHDSNHQDGGDVEHRQSRPATAAPGGRYAGDASGMSLYDAAGRRSSLVVNRQSRHHQDRSVWYNPVPPTRMPEEILQKAREDYMMEKHRVREKRMQELAAKAEHDTSAATS